MSGTARNDAAKIANVSAIVTHFAPIATVSNRQNPLNARPGEAACAVAGGLRTATPSSGANTTATNHDTMSAMLTTAKSENVYSPASLAAKPTGTKLAIVTSVPASMANA